MIILQAIYFMLPAYFANMAPVFATKILGDKFNAPLDFGLKYQDKELLGKNKTWRGLIAGVIMAILIIYLQAVLFDFKFFQNISLVNYAQINLWLYGFLLGLGVICGDAVKSFFKRRANLKPGDKWFPWDQLDFLGALLLVSLVYRPNWQTYLIIIIISPLLPIASNWLGYKLHLKKVAW